MFKLRYFLLSMNVLNGLLAAAVAAVTFYTVIPFLKPAVMSLPPVKAAAKGSGEKAMPAQGLPATDYAMISVQNLFHPERKIPPEKQPEKQEKAIPKPEVFLYGTLITDSASYAFIEDKKAPYSTPGRGKRQVTLKKGDILGGYTLSEIEPNRIVLVKGADKLVVALDDREKRRASEAAALKATAPQASPSSAPVTPAKPGTAAPGSRSPSPPIVPSSPQAPPAARQAEPSFKPGIGSSGTWPPTQQSIEQTRQKINEGRLMRRRQLQGN